MSATYWQKKRVVAWYNFVAHDCEECQDRTQSGLPFSQRCQEYARLRAAWAEAKQLSEVEEALREGS